MAAISKEDRPRKPWRVDWTERRRRRTRRFATRREATIFAGRVESGEHAAAVERTTLTDWIITWTSETGLAWEPRTRKDRARYADRFIVPELGSMRLSEIGRSDVRAWRARLLRPPYDASPYTANRCVQILSAALGAAVDDDLIAANPCRGLKPLRREGVLRRIAAPLAAIEAVRIVMEDPADRAMVSLMAYAGLRPSEARALRWDDIGERTLSVRSAISGEGREKRTKTGSTRNLPLYQPLADDLDTVPEVNTLVLGTPVDHRNWTKRNWRPACENAKVSITPYQLRHTFASLLIAEGRNAWQVAALMGHANPQMVLTVYGHLFADAELADPVPMEPAVIAARHEALSARRKASVTGPGERPG